MSDSQERPLRRAREEFDLSSCEQEPIHQPGAIQPHGALVAALLDGRLVTHASANLAEFLGLPASDALGLSLESVIGEAAYRWFGLADPWDDTEPRRHYTLARPQGVTLNLSTFVSGRHVCVDIEPAGAGPAPELSVTAAQSVLETFKYARTCHEICELAVRGLSRITGYDRVMAYRLDRDGHGEVIAEVRAARLEPYLGLRYPASDIPTQARRLYLAQAVGAVADARYQPVALLTDRALQDGAPLDLTQSALRSVSPIHRDYMRNMGTEASLTIGLACELNLWGMLVCHHTAPRVATPELRAVAKLIGQMVSVLLVSLGTAELYAAQQERVTLLHVLADRLGAPMPLPEAMAAAGTELLDLVNACGALVRLSGTVFCVGRTPRLADAEQALAVLLEEANGEPVAVDDLGLSHPTLTGCMKDGSGALLLPLVQDPGDAILWFRPEVPRTVNWGGNPAEHGTANPVTGQLSPRASFARWAETVTGHAEPWADADLAMAARFGRTIELEMARRIQVALRQQMRREQELNAELSRQAAALRESEARLRDFIDMSSDWFWEQDAEFRFTTVRWKTLDGALNLNQDAYLGKTRWHFADMDRDPELWVAHQRDLLARRPYRSFRYRRVDSDGTVRHCCVSGVPLFDSTGTFTGYRGVGIDITARVEAEHELLQAKRRAEQAETLLQDAIDSVSQGFAIHDADGRILLFNESYRLLYPAHTPWSTPGLTFADILRHGLAKGAYPDAAGHEQEWLEACLRRLQEASGETEQPLWDGRWVLITNRRMRSGGIVALWVDITTLKQVQAALHESEARLEKAQEIAGIGSWELDLESGRYRWSRQLYRILGFPTDFEPTRENATCVAPDDRPRTNQWLDDLRAGHLRPPIRFKGQRPDGTIPILRMEGLPVADADGIIRYLAGTIEDVTERQSIARQLAQAQKMEAIGNLTGGMAHDLNNMLGIVIGNLDLLTRLVKLDAVGSELCEEAMAGAARCADLMQRLLAFSRRQSLRPETIDVNALVSNIVRLLGRTLGENITVTARLGPAMWPVTADPVQLEATLVNLAVNARDAMPKGGTLDIVTSTVYFASAVESMPSELTPGDYVAIDISDTGTGVPPEIIADIFEPFFTTKEAGKGTGLGLSMAFGFAKQSGGHLSVHSEPGLGATFRLYMPRADADVEAQRCLPGTDTVTGGAETVLVVEDNTNLRRATIRQLTSLGYQVREAALPEAALAILNSGDPVDLLFTDVMMPGAMDGLALAEESARLRPGLRILLTSGFPGVREPDRRIVASAFPLLTKPYRRDRLAETVRAVLDGRGNTAPVTAVGPETRN